MAVMLIAGATSRDPAENAARAVSPQTPTWTSDDVAFHLHGSMSTEIVPENVLRAFIRTYPDLFPSEDLSHLGLIADREFGWPVGITRGAPAHLGGLTSLGVNCAACHTAEIGRTPDERVRVLGVTANFDVEAFFGAIIAATFRTAAPDEMQRFLGEYLDASDPEPDAGRRAERRVRFTLLWKRQEGRIRAALASDPGGARDAGPGGFQRLSAASLALNGESIAREAELAPLCTALLKLFHNMRVALHIPDQPPEKLPPAAGPGRSDAFGLLSAALFQNPQPFAPVKFGVVWNLDQRQWVHWDGNTRSPIGRNLLAAVGLGAPLIDKRAELDFALIERHTRLTEQIRAPRYPWPVDGAAVERGSAVFAESCARCHSGPEGDARLFAVKEVGTDPLRAEIFTAEQADRLNEFLAKLETPGYAPAREPGIRGTQKYWAPSLTGVWARAPYLHNGSVRTLRELLTTPEQRAKTFQRGVTLYDIVDLGYQDAGHYRMDTTQPGNSNAGHAYGVELSEQQKRELIEYLKTL